MTSLSQFAHILKHCTRQVLGFNLHGGLLLDWQGILGTYRTLLPKLKFAGPSRLSPTLHRVMELVKQQQQLSQESQFYYVLLVITVSKPCNSGVLYVQMQHVGLCTATVFPAGWCCQRFERDDGCPDWVQCPTDVCYCCGSWAFQLHFDCKFAKAVIFIKQSFRHWYWWGECKTLHWHWA